MTDTDTLIERLRDFNCAEHGLACMELRREAADALAALTRDPQSRSYWINAHDEKAAALAQAREALREVVDAAEGLTRPGVRGDAEMVAGARLTNAILAAAHIAGRTLYPELGGAG